MTKQTEKVESEVLEFEAVEYKASDEKPFDPKEYSLPEKLNTTNVALAKLKKECSDLKAYDKESYKIVKSHAIDIAKRISAVEKRRKETKAPLIEAGKLLDQEATRIKDFLNEVLVPLKLERETFEAEEQKKKDEEARIEKERVDRILGQIARIEKYCSPELLKKSSEEINKSFEFFKACMENDSFNYEEFLTQAVQAKEQVNKKFEEAYKTAQANEEQQKELERVRKELEELKAAQAQEKAKIEPKEKPAEAPVEVIEKKSVNIHDAIKQTKEISKPSLSSFSWASETRPIQPYLAQEANAEVLIEKIAEASPFVKALRGILHYANEEEAQIIKNNFNI